MNINEHLTFLLIVIITTLSPGPAVLLAVTNGAMHGLRKTAVAIAGNVTALMAMAAVSALGLGAVLLASTTLFTLIKWVGGIYLVYLGIKIWRSKTLVSDEGVADRCTHHASTSSLKLFQQAFFSFAFLMAYAMLSNQARRWLSKPRNGKLFQRVSGGTFVGLGIGMIATQRQ